MADIGEKIFEAFDIIIQERLSGLHFDKTITGVIESIEGIAEEGKENTYIVNDGSTKYTAYSNNVYKVNTSVYVSIPNGDYTQKKFITGYSVSSTNDDASLLNNDNFVSILDSVWKYDGNEYGLVANGSKAELDNLIEWTSSPQAIKWTNGQVDENSINYNLAPSGYSSIKVSADFRTELGSIMPISGNYGLMGTIIGVNKNGAIVTDNFNLDVSDMFGNPYNFDGWFPQTKIISLKNDFNIVLDVLFTFFQDGDFKTEDRKKIPNSFENIELPSNLFVKNINISLGYLQNELKSKDTLFIYPNENGQIYLGLNHDTEKQPLILKARWIHKHEDNFLAINNLKEANQFFGENNKFNTKIEWYQESLTNRPNGNDYILSNQKLHRIDDAKDFVADISNKIELDSLENKYKAAIQYVNYDNVEENFNPKDPSSLTEEETALLDSLIKINTVTTTSEDVVYRNISKSDSSEIAERINGVFLAHVGEKDKYHGIYNIYYNGHLNSSNKGEAAIERVLQPQFKSKDINGNLLSFKAGDEIKWTIPYSAYTMIDTSHLSETPKDKIDSSNLKVEIVGEGIDKVKVITSTVKNKIEVTLDDNGNEIKTELDEVDLSTCQLIYKIKESYTPLRDSNNTIKCLISIKDGIKYEEISVTPSFGTTGTIGSNYGIEIKLEREYTFNEATGEFLPWKDDSLLYAIPSTLATIGGTIENNNWVKVTAELHHINKDVGDFQNFEWSWLDENLSELQLYKVKEDESNYKGQFNYIRWKDDIGNKISTKSILKVSCSIDGLNLVEYFPIPSKINSSVYAIEGSDRIIYNSNGILKQYYASPYNLLYNEEKWNKDNFEYIINGDTKSLSLTDKNILNPLNIYCENISNIQCLQLKVKDSDILWSQPIYVYQDKWPSEVLNQWDNGLTINENNGTILSAMMAAGSKDNENAFTGVVMGKVKLDENEPENGLFGFKDGKETFGFKTNGTGFIGSSTGARIEFDGTNGFIQNADFESVTDNITGKEIGATKGLKIDFANAKILSPSFQLTQETGTTATAGTIAGWSFNNSQLSSENTVFLYSHDQYKKDENGNIIKDENGNMIKDESTVAGYKTNTWRIRIGNTFGVTSGGTVYGNVIKLNAISEDISSTLNTLSSEHSSIDTRVSSIENLSTYTDEDENIVQTEIYKQLKTNGSNNNLTILGRIINLENNLGTKPGNVSKSIYQRVADLEALLKDFKEEEITYIEKLTPQTETITITEEDGSSKTITVITGITSDTVKKTVLVKNTQ